MIKILWEGFGVIVVLSILIFCFVKYIKWTVPIIKEHFFKQHSNELDKKLARLDFEDWLSDNIRWLIIIGIVLGVIGFFNLILENYYAQGVILYIHM